MSVRTVPVRPHLRRIGGAPVERSDRDLQVDWLQASMEARRIGTEGLRADLPRARRTDPEPSHAAAENVRRSGQLRETQVAAIDLVRQNPGCTAGELAELASGTVVRGTARDASWWRYELGRRLGELVPVHVLKGEARRCLVKSTMQTTWYPRDRGGAQS